MGINNDIEKTGKPLVRISCNQCGERFILRGTPDKNGSITVNIKMCFCGNKDLKKKVLSPVNSPPVGLL
jgi:hypothetical protein